MTIICEGSKAIFVYDNSVQASQALRRLCSQGLTPRMIHRGGYFNALEVDMEAVEMQGRMQ